MTPIVLKNGSWLNEPVKWSSEEDSINVTTDKATDFWRKTFYGFVRDSGHFLGHSVEGPFTAEIRVRGRYEALYDQAGLMVRIDQEKWVKTGVEFTDDMLMLSTVVTDGQSDWSVTRAWDDARDFYLRLTVAGGALRVQISFDQVTWPLLRLAPFPEASRYWVGPTCCSPERAGLEVTFSDFKIGPPTAKGLHDLT